MVQECLAQDTFEFFNSWKIADKQNEWLNPTVC